MKVAILSFPTFFGLTLFGLTLFGLEAQPKDAIVTAAGVTRQNQPIPAWIGHGDLDYKTAARRILLVGNPASVRRAMEWFYGSSEARRYQGVYTVSAIPIDGLLCGCPPSGEFYLSKTDVETQYLWRWIGVHAPDMVLVFVTGHAKAHEGLAEALSSQTVAGVGAVPSMEIEADGNPLPHVLADFDRRRLGVSPARQEMQRRLARTPAEVAAQLAVPYGHEFKEAVYIPAMALIGRLRMGAVADIEKIVAPYANGERPSLPEGKITSSHVSGHLVFAELYERTKDPRYLALVKAAANLAFDENGNPREAMPYHNEMSDAVFMGTPILVKAGKLTGETKYYDMAMRHMRFMLKLNLRADGLHRHSPLDLTAWGRGNGFPALGLALSLSDLPESYLGRAEMLAAFRAHMAALVPFQDETGMWHQVVDFAGSYREFTATAMIAFAMQRGVTRGWLDKATYQPVIDHAWYALKTRIAPDGSLIDVCTNTGKQKSLRDYLDRPAILGIDARGGAMGLLLATELAR